MKHDALGYWLEEAGTAFPAAPLDGPLEADVLVIGGGYTGMWTAWHLLQEEPEARVVLLEAGSCGHGPSGRNGGFVNSLWLSLGTMSDRYGPAPALAVARASEASVDEIGRFCEEQRVDAWYRKSGYLVVSGSPTQDESLRRYMDSVRRLGGGDRFEDLSADAVTLRCRSPRFRGAALFADAATLQPARLALGLRARLVERGAVICEGSPVRRLREGPGGVVAETPRGVVSAPSAVLAIGGAAASQRSPMRNRLTVTSSHMVITEPVPDLLEEIGWTRGESISDIRAMVHYMRTTPDGRIAFGWGGGPPACGARLGGRVERNPDLVAEVGRHLRAFFPGLEERRLTHAWGGPIDVSPTHLPTVAALPGGRAFAAFGFTGNGVGPTQMVGRTMASLALDRRDEHSRLAFVDPSPARVPPEPLRFLGGTAIRAGILRKERAEEEGREPDRISRGLAAVPELIGFHINR
ncbi:MAG: NAD(P)/FAD-dependent oxidoreductase [Solirubrobacterales bacterium]